MKARRSPASNFSILFVCDEPLFRVTICELLEENGYITATCLDLEAAQTQLAQRPYALVLLHLLAEPHAALDAAIKLRKIRPKQRIAFIAGPWNRIAANYCPTHLIAISEGAGPLLNVLGKLSARFRASKQPSREAA